MAREGAKSPAWGEGPKGSGQRACPGGGNSDGYINVSSLCLTV